MSGQRPAVLTWAVLGWIVLAAGCSESPGARDAGFDGPGDARPDRQGFDLTSDQYAPDVIPASSDRCGGGATVTLESGVAVIDSTTSGASNEYGGGIRCGEQAGYRGPQRYFRVEMVAGHAYRMTVEPQFDAVTYLFSACAANIINADCGSGGSMGISSGPIAAGAKGSLLFVPPASGTYHLAVDSASDDQQGEFKLTVESFFPPDNATCPLPQQLTLVDGAVTVDATTLGALNQFAEQITCGLGLTFDGPQVYFSVSLQAGKWYRLSLSPELDAALYVANVAADCKSENIEQDCSSVTGTVLPQVEGGATAATAFSPPVDGDYLVVVDSIEPQLAGNFTLGIERFTPATHMICDKALPALLVDGATVIRGDTSPMINDRGAQASCGAQPLIGPQAYYRVALEAKNYLLTLTPTFDAVLAVGSSCLTLPVDCLGGGAGAAVSVGAAGQGKLFFQAPAAGDYLVMVDGLTSTAKGKFKVTVAEASAPKNGSCGAPQQLTLANGALSIAGETGPLQNDLIGVDCGGTVGSWPGPQAYFRVSLPAGSHTVELEPEATFDAALYAFAASTACDPAAINVACAGSYSDASGGGAKESLSLSPTTTQDWILVVDSWSPSDVGTFTLRVTTP